MEPDWERFVIALAEEDSASDSPLYQLIVTHYPLQFMHKLLDTVEFGSGNVIKCYAIDMIKYHFNTILRRHYSSMERELVISFQKSALGIFLSKDDCIYVNECGRDVIGTLLELQLDENGRWEGFEEAAAELLSSTENEKLRHYILDVVVNLPDEQRHSLIGHMGPRFTRRHFWMLLKMFSSGDGRAFAILPSIPPLFPHLKLSYLMEVATSCLFVIDPWEKCRGASAIAFCLRHFDLELSPKALSWLRDIIITWFLQTNDAEEKRTAILLSASLLIDCLAKSLGKAKSGSSKG